MTTSKNADKVKNKNINFDDYLYATNLQGDTNSLVKNT